MPTGFLLFVFALVGAVQGTPTANLLAITHVTVIEGTDSIPRADQTVVDVVKLHGQIPPAVYFAAALAPRFPIQSVLGRCTSGDLAPLFARFVRNGTWIVPTLVAAYEIALWPTRALPGDAFAQQLPDTLRRFVAQIFQMPPGIPADANEVGRALFEKRLALVGAMHRAGVAMLPGTDAPLRNSPPGFGLHEELALMVRAGVSPFQVLHAATLEPAGYFGLLDSLGTVALGKVADRVLLGASPLLDIRNTRRVEAVLQNGRLVSP